MLTKKQHDLLEFIHKRAQKDGVPPSFDEMKEALNLRSKSGIHRLITALEERGFIRRLAHRARAIEVVKLPESLGEVKTGFMPKLIDGGRPNAPAPAAAQKIDSTQSQQLPLIGRIAAGIPMESIADEAPQVTVPTQMLSGQGQHYALEVKGDSMINAGINEGDIVVIRETNTAENGDIVVAQIEGYEATLKRFKRMGDVVALEAANPAYETRIFGSDRVKVQGKLIGLIRRY